jgi:hypothetical protein
MKKIVVLLLGLGTALQLQAQIFNPESVTGAAVGGILGGVIGHNSGRHGGEGAAIGAGLGFLFGNLAHHSRQRAYYRSDYPAYGYGYYDSDYGYGYRPRYYTRYQAVTHTQPAQQQVTVNNHNYTQPSTPSSSMSSANALFGR